MLAKLVRPHHLKLFFSNKHLHVSIISKVDDNTVVSVSTNNKHFTDTLGIYAPKNDERACEAAAAVLIKKAVERKVGVPIAHLPDMHFTCQSKAPSRPLALLDGAVFISRGSTTIAAQESRCAPLLCRCRHCSGTGA